MGKRKQYSAEFKTKVVLEVLREERTVSEIAAIYEVSSVMISRWKAEFLEKASGVFQRGMSDAEKELAKEREKIERLERKVGQLTYELDWVKKKNWKSKNESDAIETIERNNQSISIKRQCELLGVERSRVYQKPKQRRISAEELNIRLLIDRMHTDEPTWGYRKITHRLRNCGYSINQKRVRRIMREMGIYAIYPKKNLSKMFHAQYVMPYLLRNREITHPDHVWGVDITYIPMAKGFMYLFVIIDWYSRYIVDYELSSTLHKEFVLKCMNRALTRCRPDIVNSDQGSHFTNPDYIGLLKKHGVKISMDGKGRCLDNAKTERFFRSIKYDRIYVYEINSPRELRKIVREYMSVYNNERPHASLDGQTPANFYGFGNTFGIG